MRIACELKLTGMMRFFFEQRFVRGLKQHEIAERLRITQPAVSDRERRIRNRFTRAGLPVPTVPGRKLYSVSCASL